MSHTRWRMLVGEWNEPWTRRRRPRTRRLGGEELSAPRRIALAVPSTGEEEWLAVREPLLEGWVAQGPKVEAFEGAFAARHGVRHAVAASSGTTALHLVLAALGLGPGDEVIVPSFTWVATANTVVYCAPTWTRSTRLRLG